LIGLFIKFICRAISVDLEDHPTTVKGHSRDPQHTHTHTHTHTYLSYSYSTGPSVSKFYARDQRGTKVL
jgi:hypothetical protein